jgi:hypothetical protein
MISVDIYYYGSSIHDRTRGNVVHDFLIFQEILTSFSSLNVSYLQGYENEISQDLIFTRMDGVL